MRTTVELTDKQRAALLRLAAERGEKGFSSLVQEAVDEYLRAREQAADRTAAALAVLGTLSKSSAAQMKENIEDLRSRWR